MNYAKTFLLIPVSFILIAACGGVEEAPNHAAAGQVEQNKAVARRFFTEVWGGGSEAVAQELLADSYVGHMTGNPATIDRASGKAGGRTMRSAFCSSLA